ncbi:acyl-CoA synthetase [Aquirhabdus sp.]|uniref:acyl-CoA synthetase n=1 Tax=Aquirhabdus sp. TaxID=2824160 RepID=UPI00396CCB9F
MKGIATQADVLQVEALGLPADLPISTYEMIQRGAAINPRAPALSFFLRTEDHRHPEVWSYKTLLARITQTANFFHQLGATKDTVIAFVLPNLPETHCVIWGGQAAGIVTAINPLLEPAAIAELLNAANASIVVTLAPFPGTDVWPKMGQALPQVSALKHLVLINLADKVHGLKGLAAQLLQKRETLRVYGLRGVRSTLPRHIGIHDFNSGLKRQPKHTLISGRHIAADDYASFFCTGGTTGTPKIAMRSHRNEVANAWSAAQFFGEGIGSGKQVFCGLPLFHVNGVLVTGLLPFSKGAHVILGTAQGYRGEGVVKRFWEIVAHHRINFFSGVPTLYASLLQVPIGTHRISSLEYGLCGAAPLPIEVLRSFQERTGLKILEGYGLTEATCVSSVNPPLGERRVGSIGLRIPEQAMKAVRVNEDGRYEGDCAPGEVGVLLVSGPNVFSGYRIPAQNKGLWLDLGDGRQWLNTGDLGQQDIDGYFFLTGRKKELIIRGGHNIDPALIEEPLHKHPAVALAAAVGRPDAHAGELPVAYVQLKAGAHTTEAELLTFIESHMTERAALPKQIHIIAEMPLTAVGKIFKPTLKHIEIKHALTLALHSAHLSQCTLSVRDDKSRGIVIDVLLSDQTLESDVRKVLGQFPFFVNIESTALLAGC